MVSETLSQVVTEEFSRLEKAPAMPWLQNNFYKDGLPVQPGDVVKNPRTGPDAESDSRRRGRCFLPWRNRGGHCEGVCRKGRRLDYERRPGQLQGRAARADRRHVPGL